MSNNEIRHPHDEPATQGPDPEEINLDSGSSPAFALRNPHTAIVGALIAALLGVVGFTQMPIDVFPRLHIKAAVVGTFYPGFAPLAMEANITSRYERFFTLGSGIEHIESRSIPGASIITVYFHQDVNIYAGAANLATLAMSDLGLMPPGTLPPLVLTYNASSSIPVLLVTVSGPYSQTRLQNNARYNVRNFLATVHGASVPYPFGGKVRQIMAYLERQKLQARGLSLLDVVNQINATNQIVPAGDAKIGDFDWYVYANAEIPHPRDLDSVPIFTGKDQAPVYFGDLGKGKDAAELQYNLVLIDGRPAVYIPIFKQTGANTLEVINGVKKALPQVTGLRSGMKLGTLFSQESTILDAVEALEHEAVAGSILASLMIFIFLGNLRSTLAIFLSIPLSVLAAIFALSFSNNTINIMTLGGLTLALGRLVDDSTVVLENINRHLAMGKSSLAAALQGAEEVTYAVLASTTTTVVVFLPVIFLWGVSKHLFTALALAVTYAMFASYRESMMIVPLSCARFLNPKDAERFEAIARGEEHGGGFIGWFNRGYNRFNNAFAGWLDRALDHKLALISAIAVIFAASMAIFPLLGTRMFPRTDAGKFVINIRTPPGTRLEITEAMAQRVDQIIRQVVPPRDLKTVVANLGVVPLISAIYTTNSGEDDGQVFVSLKEGHRRSSFYYEDRVRQALTRQLPEVQTFFSSGSIIDAVLNFGALSAVDVQLSAPMIEPYPKIFAFARTIQQRLNQLPEVRQTMIKQISDYPTLTVDVNREKAARLHVTERDVVLNLITALDNNEMVKPSIWIDPESGDDYYLSAQYFENKINSFETLLDLPVGSRFDTATYLGHPPDRYSEASGHKQPVLLRELATLKRESYPAEADHYNIQRVVDVLVSPKTKDWGGTLAAVQKTVAQLPPHKNIRVYYRGSVELMKKSFQSFYGGFILTVIIVYLIGVAQGRSWLDPFIFLFSIPMGLIGVAIMLYITNTTLNIESMMGIIVMIGIVHSNVILLIEFANERRKEGMPLRQAIITATRTRMRPILMTTLATLAALSPVALKLEPGSEASAPLARTVIGGLSVSTFMTLFLAPALWELFYSWKKPTARSGQQQVVPR
ncbi:MAG: efflux RND transporter permease subunit [Thermaerobacter sp.]|nr:efflux RND transporter permease subunit [Thermaerobacter sp.]